jgi:conjugal transfer pilus assembly protein TraV
VKHVQVKTFVLGNSVLLLSGCTSMAGLGGSSSYACQAPEGVTCNSVSGVYANAIRANLPDRQARAAASAPASTPALALTAGAPRPTAPAHTGDPSTGQDELRSRPRILRLWFKPWEDADNDLFDQGYVYVQIDAGQWRVDHVHRRNRDGYSPVRPPRRSEGGSAGPASRSAPRPPPDVSQDPRAVPRPTGQQPGTE